MSIHVAGLDLGQAQDYTALVIIQASGTTRQISVQTRDRETGLPISSDQPIEVMPLSQVAIRHVERFPLGTKYYEIERQMRTKLVRVPSPRYFALDKTGVGVGVIEIFAGLAPIGITFTAGGQTTMDGPQSYCVPKRDLIGTAQVMMQNRVMKMPPKDKMPLGELLVKELLNFRQKISIGGHDTYEAWRQADHDDLVNALAIACWVAQTIISAAALEFLRRSQQRRDPPVISPY